MNDYIFWILKELKKYNQTNSYLVIKVSCTELNIIFLFFQVIFIFFKVKLIFNICIISASYVFNHAM